VHHVVELAGRNVAAQHAGGRRDGVGCLRVAVQQCTIRHAIEEFRGIAVPMRSGAGIPVLVEDPPHQERKLCGELRGLVDPEAVPQNVQETPQDAVGQLSVLGTELDGELVEPDVRLLAAAIDADGRRDADGSVEALRAPLRSAGGRASREPWFRVAGPGSHPGCAGLGWAV
jgi:hypothetical protein